MIRPAVHWALSQERNYGLRGSSVTAMSDSNTAHRFRHLFYKQQAGTITATEAAALRQHCDLLAQQTFDTCPVCQGAFSQYAARARPFRCPQCAIELATCSGDMLPHQPHEVDDSIAKEPLLGEFAVWYYPVGCSPCACGVRDAGYFPAAYSCCPSLLVLAAEMCAGGNPRAYQFLCDHRATLVNALRGDFYTSFNIDHLTLFCDDARWPADHSAIAAILQERAR